jgi:hypothetical protein
MATDAEALAAFDVEFEKQLRDASAAMEQA